MLEWVAVEPINGARTWVLCLAGKPVNGADVDDQIFFWDD